MFDGNNLQWDEMNELDHIGHRVAHDPSSSSNTNPKSMKELITRLVSFGYEFHKPPSGQEATDLRDAEGALASAPRQSGALTTLEEREKNGDLECCREFTGVSIGVAADGALPVAGLSVKRRSCAKGRRQYPKTKPRGGRSSMRVVGTSEHKACAHQSPAPDTVPPYPPYIKG
ncbi:hypothetical protein CYLTODRAFT_413279 [Cylindrobasidium torrendii FP15055 ss-10]|uniref:Uncharacterized protein n=1 Tax=Cylindrobasidium torrendii FP15055 ss-10 TaxID=1314674 RepID=A0A0D7B1L9_9AGAR|nr:hypothetical protein CYLTODRAFT_413279 [Cylindrobasidium torrendii FP15055 ss-10]